MVDGRGSGSPVTTRRHGADVPTLAVNTVGCSIGMGAADALRHETGAALEEFTSAAGAADLDATTSSGWTAKEMVAHVAFWLETTPPFVTGAFRGDESAFNVTFPSGYAAGDGEWPDADIHNAREAAWARDQTSEAVLGRLRAAGAGLRTFLESVTDDEATAQAAYYGDIAGHLRTHRQELAT